MADIKESVEDLKLPADATPFERTLYATVKKDMAILVAEVERLRGLPMLENAEARRRIQLIQSGHIPNRQDFPDSMKGSLARDHWNGTSPESLMFQYGIEYGYLLAMLDIAEDTDSVTLSQSPTDDHL